MAYVTLSDPLPRLVVWITIALLVMVLLLLLQIVLLRIRLITRTAREQRFLETWRPQMVATTIGQSHAFPPLDDSDKFFFLKLWNHLHESLRGKAKTRLNILAAGYGIAQYAHSLLHRNDLGLQLLALNTLGLLKDRTAWQDILHLARLPDPLLSFSAARTLFQIDAGIALNDLRQSLLEREDWPPAQFALLLQENCTEDNFTVLIDTATRLAAATEPVELARLDRLLQLLEVAPYRLMISAIRAILAATADDQIAAHCLKYLREPHDLPSVRSLLDHPNWIVRLQAARALGRIGTAEDVPLLTRLLSDPVWWVRYRTAQALQALTRGHTQSLAELRTRLDDRYARDMLEMVMAEKEGR